MVQICPKTVFLFQSRKSENHHRLQQIRLSHRHLQQTILIIWTKFIQKRYFRSDYIYLHFWLVGHRRAEILPHSTVKDKVGPPVRNWFGGCFGLFWLGSFCLVAAFSGSLPLLQTTPHEDSFPVEKVFENTSFEISSLQSVVDRLKVHVSYKAFSGIPKFAVRSPLSSQGNKKLEILLIKIFSLRQKSKSHTSSNHRKNQILPLQEKKSIVPV